MAVQEQNPDSPCKEVNISTIVSIWCKNMFVSLSVLRREQFSESLASSRKTVSVEEQIHVISKDKYPSIVLHQKMLFCLLSFKYFFATHIVLKIGNII